MLGDIGRDSSFGLSRANTRRTRSSEMTWATLAPFGSQRAGRPLIPNSRMINSTA
jgi:hypothetical protein